MSGRPRRLTARGIMAGAVVAFVALLAPVLALSLLATADALYLGALLVIVPGLAMAQLDALGETRIERIPAYGGSVVALMILTGATITVGARDGGVASLGLVRLPLPALVGWTTLLAVGGLVTILSFRAAATWLGIADTLLLRDLIPRTPHEKAVFAILSFWAGVGEELAYRGYAILTLAPLAGAAASAAVTSAVFGVLHAYQGAIGMLRAGTMGAVLAWGLLASGSLWPPLVAHVVIDLLAGLVLADRLMVPAGAGGVEGSEGPSGRPDHPPTAR